MKYLDKINSPADLRKLPAEQLPEVAEEIRSIILDTVSQNSAGGHLASSLGAVELTLALHYVYQTPDDKLIWDVGHQGYPHKLLTGRCGNFRTLRKRDGVSGFLRRSESEYDVFGAGHAGTSISAAVGLAKARDLQKQGFKVVAIIGDGSMTCGLPFEAMNNAGQHSDSDLLVILNDNEMSISGNVGALHKYFNQVVQSRLYNRGKEEARTFVKKAPMGDAVLNFMHKLEESAKGLILPSLFFEDLGFRYIGPVDGHDLEELIPTLQNIRTFKGPVLLHACTRKGKGYKLAEGAPIFWHAPPNFNVESGEYKKSTSRTFTHVYGDTLVELAGKNDKVVAITAAMATGTGLVKFSESFPDRFVDVGIAEGHAVTSAAGMALDGIRPFVTIYSTFLQRAYDGIMHDVALQNLPVVFAMDRAGLVGFDGPTHHGLLDIAYMRIIPNMVVMAPKDEAELRDMMLTAANHVDGPIAFRYPRAGVTGADTAREPREIPLGKGEIIREGNCPVALLSYGHIYTNVMRAAEILEQEGIHPAIVNARFVKPLDMDLLAEIADRYPVVLSIEEGVVSGGFGSAVAEALTVLGKRNHFEILAVPDRFIEHGDQASQQAEAGLSPEAIAGRVRQALEKFRESERTQSRFNPSRATDSSPAGQAKVAHTA